jgi:hypothetical protein
MYCHLVSNPSKQLLCPLLCYTDGTQIDSMSRFCVEPFLFTPAMLSYAACCKAEAWRPFGSVQHLRRNLQSDNCKLDVGRNAFSNLLVAMLK